MTKKFIIQRFYNLFTTKVEKCEIVIEKNKGII